jgi:NAD-dependent deacetylase
MTKIEKLYQYIQESKRIVFFGGAGVSTESGIPDFRSKDGLYNQHDVQFDMYEPEYLLSKTCLYHNPKVFYEFYRQKLDARNVEPNIAHYWLAELEQQGKLSAIVTQNIDGLHQKAGSKNVYEIHGTTQKNYCNKCRKEYDADYIFNTTEKIPKCECGGQIRPDVTLYEEKLPWDAWNNAVNDIAKADMLIIAGTSLTVYPAASFVNHFMGKYLVIINRDKIDHIIMCEDTDLQINDSLGNVVRQLKELKL